ncbi:MAG: bifunctional demethylmenaquinone methyltransferase/2-methoxy-6-polyprenyl-1,4-benzoquinol methylase UbiE [Chitinophagales bacterium]
MAEQVTPYSSGEEKKAQVRTMFNRIAGRYDLLNRILSLGIDIYWRNVAIRALKRYKPGRILDVACGTGDFSIAALKTGAKEIIGVDIADQMLEKGNAKMQRKGLQDRIRLEHGDSEALVFPDEHFDAVTVAFGVRNFGDLEKGLNEMRRVLKKGAPVFILEFSTPHVFPVKQLYQFYFSTILPALGRLISGDAKAYTYLYESVKAFPERAAFTDILKRCGYTQCRYKRLSFGICSLYMAEK